jgi:hypothetical protein
MIVPYGGTLTNMGVGIILEILYLEVDILNFLGRDRMVGGVTCNSLKVPCRPLCHI